MEFKLTVQQANDLREFSKLIKVTKKAVRDARVYDLIECRISGGFLTAKIFVGAALTSFECRAEGEEGLCFIAPPTTRFSEKDGVYVTVTAEEDCTIYTTERSSVTLPFKRNQSESTLNCFGKEAVYTMRVNPKLWAEVLSEYAACGNDSVQIECTEKYVWPDYISDEHGRKTAVMEMSPNNKQDKDFNA